jgi:hypothetical protein
MRYLQAMYWPSGDHAAKETHSDVSRRIKVPIEFAIQSPPFPGSRTKAWHCAASHPGWHSASKKNKAVLRDRKEKWRVRVM